MLIRLHRAVSRPSAYHTDAGKALSFSRRGQSTADGGAYRVRKRAICGCSKRLRQRP
jgi:hypothetical protein